MDIHGRNLAGNANNIRWGNVGTHIAGWRRCGRDWADRRGRRGWRKGYDRSHRRGRRGRRGWRNWYDRSHRRGRRNRRDGRNRRYGPQQHYGGCSALGNRRQRDFARLFGPGGDRANNIRHHGECDMESHDGGE